jgi:hypothetical protein
MELIVDCRVLTTLAAAQWDFRRGGERDSISELGPFRFKPTPCSRRPPIWALAAGERPLEAPLRHTVIATGGMVRAGFRKPRFVAELLEYGLECDHPAPGGFLTVSREGGGTAHAWTDADDEFGGMPAGPWRRRSGPRRTEISNGAGKTAHSSSRRHQLASAGTRHG